MRHEIIDRLIIFGVLNPERLKLSEIVSNKIKVSALQFYSLNNHNREHQNEIDFEMWAYPDGIKIANEYHQILNDQQPQFSFTQSHDIISEIYRKDGFLISDSELLSVEDHGGYPPDYIYSFVLTDYQLNRTYCTCLNWNEKYFVKNDLANQNVQLVNSYGDKVQNSQMLKQYAKNPQHYSKAVPKCKINTLLNNPLILDPTVTLVFIPKSMIVCSFGLSCIQLQWKLLKHFYSSVILPKRKLVSPQNLSFKIDETLYQIFDKLSINNGYSEAEKLFDSKNINNKDILQFLIKNNNSTKRIAMSVSRRKLKQFYIASFFLLQKTTNKASILSENGRPIAGHINLKTAYSLPEYYEMFSQNSSLLPLSVESIIKLWKCLLLQKQILIFSHSQYQSMLICELLLYLLQPIKWENIYIPFLPFHLSHHIDAIGGYLIGMSHIHMSYMIQNFDMKQKVVVDLKNKIIIEQGGRDNIELPGKIKNYLQSNLELILKQYETESSNINTNPSSLASFLIPFGNSNQMQIPLQTARKLLYVRSTIEIQRVFFNSIVYMFNNFIPFIQKRLEGVISFQTKSYLQILQDQAHQNFMKQISKTMVFIRLCEYHLEESERCAMIQKTIGELFVYSHDILSKKYIIENPSSKEKEKIVSAWPLQQLLTSQNKYYQYHQYLFDKNVNQITNLVKKTDLYFINQLKNYQHLQRVNSNHELQRNEVSEINTKQYSQKNSKMYKQLKWKKYGQKDEEDLEEEVRNLINDLKIEKYLVKYIKYMELNDPKRIIRRISDPYDKNIQEAKGWFSWFLEIINPPIISRKKQEKQKIHKLKRKITEIGGIFNQALDLKQLFSTMKDQFFQQKKQKQKVEEIQQFQEERKMVDFREYYPERRLSKAHSEDIKIKKKNNKN